MATRPSSRHGEEQEALQRVAAPTGDLSDAVMQTLAEESPDAIVVVDVQGRLVWGNQQAEQLFGYGRAELLGQTVELLLPDRVQKVHLAHRAAYMENPRTRRMGVGLDLNARRRDGATIPVEISLTPLSTDSGDMVIATVRDISERQAIAGEQAALRRVATLVARGVPPEEMFAGVTAEAGRVLDADFTSLARYDPDGRVTLLAAWTGTGDPWPVPVGSRWDLGGGNLSTLVSRTRQPARLDGFGDDIGLWAADVLTLGVHSAVAVPISVEGRLWGLISVFSTHEQPLPAGTEARLAGFTELVATAIANAQARVELRGFAEEQAALRRVATLVARGTPPEEVFAAVTAEAGRVLGVGFTTMSRYHPDGAVTVVGAWSGTGIPVIFPAGTRLSAGGSNLHTQVFQTGQPARLDTIAGDLGPALAPALAAGIRTAVGVPISVEGRLGRHERVLHGGGAALGRHRGAAGRVHRAGRHRDRQRAGPGRAARVRRGAGRAAAGGDAGGPGHAAGGGLRRGHRRGRPGAGRGLHGDEPVRAGRRADGRRRLGQVRLPRGAGRHPGDPRGTERTHTGLRDGGRRGSTATARTPARRRPPRSPPGCARLSVCRSGWRASCGAS